ncbi:hypothetical protein [Microcystis sp.]|uniref:hypothetical protein n=1 Tax=Microcystis sp. TaxID=1127 RepID=UPI00391B337B
MTSYSLVFFSLSQISGAGRQELGVGRQEIIFIYSPHFPTPHTPTSHFGLGTSWIIG